MSEPSIFDQLGETQQRMLMSLLHGPDGLSADRLSESLKISTNAVRQHLAVLERDGLVARAGRKPTRGRPEHLFVLTDQGREIFPRHYLMLAESLIVEMGETLGDQEFRTLMRRVGEKAAHENGPRGSGKAVTLSETASAMKQAGYEAQMSPDANNEIVAHNCVFHQLAARYPAVCEFDLGFLEETTGKKVDHTECMLRGGNVCRFAFRGLSDSGSGKN